MDRVRNGLVGTSDCSYSNIHPSDYAGYKINTRRTSGLTCFQGWSETSLTGLSRDTSTDTSQRVLPDVVPLVEPGRVESPPMGTCVVDGASFHVDVDDVTAYLMRLLSTANNVEAYTEESM